MFLVTEVNYLFAPASTPSVLSVTWQQQKSAVTCFYMQFKFQTFWDLCSGSTMKLFKCGCIVLFGEVDYVRFLSLERDRDREWWCLELLGDFDDSIVCFLWWTGEPVLVSFTESLSLPYRKDKNCAPLPINLITSVLWNHISPQKTQMYWSYFITSWTLLLYVLQLLEYLKRWQPFNTPYNKTAK